MRIGIEAQRLFRKKKHGMEVVALEIIRQLQLIDRENEYVIFVKEDEDKECIKETENFKINILPSSPYPVWEQFTLPGAARKAGIELLHCTSNTAPVYHRGLPLVLTLHDIIYLEALNFKGTAYQNFGNIYRRLVVPQIVNNCRKIITVSQFEKQKILNRLKLPEDKVDVVYNAMNPDFRIISDHEVLAATKKRHALPDDFILFFGNTAPKKNTPGAIKAYITYARAVSQPLPLVITDIERDYIGRLMQENKARDLMALIHVKDYIPFSELPAVYNQAAIFLYPSLRESFGMPILEAMACGTPVVTSDTSSMPEVAGGAALLADPFQPEDIAAQLIKLHESNDLRGQIAKEGLQRSAFFNWKNASLKILDIYKSIA